jgi:hypothetical protein
MDESRDVYIRAKIVERYLELEIIDYGIGIDNINEIKQNQYSFDCENEHSGMGITIMKSLSNYFEIHSTKGLGTKIVVKKGDNEYSSVLDLYVSKYPNLNVPASKPFIKELERIIDNGIRSDIFEINTIEFETSNAYKIDDMYHFEFGDIQLERIFEFNGCYIIRLITNIIDGGTDKTEEFYSERMAKRYENKESKKLTYHVDVNAQIRTYVCADCGKTVTYDARALDAMNASDDFSDGKITEYLDFEMTEHEFGRMLCKDCAMKEQEKIYNNVINNINK